MAGKITREAIEEAIFDPDPVKKCLSVPSIAERIGTTRQLLWEWAVRNDLTWLLLPGQIDHAAIARSIEGGAMAPSDISRRISSKNCSVPANRVRDYMARHGLKFPSKPKRKFTPKRTILSVEYGGAKNHHGKEFPRVTNEIRLARMRRAA